MTDEEMERAMRVGLNSEFDFVKESHLLTLNYAAYD